MRIILASGSPRRKELLEKIGVEFDVVVSNAIESVDSSLSPEENVKNLASLKGNDVFQKNKDRVVLAADTVVSYNGVIYGKPKDYKDAFRMLKNLQGNTHQVFTGVAIYKDNLESHFVVRSDVTFKKMTDEEIDWYINTKEPMDKAGAYGIQGLGGRFVSSYSGEFENIMGLPIKEVQEELKKFI